MPLSGWRGVALLELTALCLPAVIGGVARLHRHEHTRRRGADFAAGPQLGHDRRTIARDVDDMRGDLDVMVGRGRAFELDAVFGRHGAWRRVRAGLLHEVVRRGPVRVTVHEGADDAAGQRTVVRLVEGLGAPRRDDLGAADVALHAQPLLVAPTAAETSPA